MEPPSPADLLVRLLDLERVAPERFRGEASGRGKRLFGGLVAAQAIVAAGRSVAGANLHSLHAYFLRPGRPGVPIDYDVELTKEGRNFHARTVRAAQEDETIFTMMTSFTRPEDGIAHQDPMPEAPPPEDLPDRDRLRGHRDWASPASHRRKKSPDD